MPTQRGPAASVREVTWWNRRGGAFGSTALEPRRRQTGAVDALEQNRALTVAGGGAQGQAEGVVVAHAHLAVGAGACEATEGGANALAEAELDAGGVGAARVGRLGPGEARGAGGRSRGGVVGDAGGAVPRLGWRRAVRVALLAGGAVLGRRITGAVDGASVAAAMKEARS